MMENLNPNSSSKRLFLLLSFSFGLIVISLIYFTIIQKPSEKNPITNIPVPTKIENFPEDSSLKISQSPWKVYKTTQYQITIPGNWKVKRYNASEQGEMTEIKPDYLKENEFYPRIIISVIPGLKAKKFGEKYLALGFKVNDFSLENNNPCSKYTNSYSKKLVGNQYVDGWNQEIYILCEKNPYTYSFQYQYEGDQINSGYEDFFNGVVKSIKFL